MIKSRLFCIAVIIAGSFFTLGAEIQTGLLVTEQYADNEPSALMDTELSVSGYLFTGTENTIHLALNGNGRFNTVETDTAYNLGTELLFTHLTGSTVIGMQLEGTSMRSDFDGSESFTGCLSIPFTLNSEAASFHLSPFGEINPLDSGYTAIGCFSFFSFLLNDFVLKPGLDGSYLWGKDGSDTFTLSPGVKISWYPGFPIASGFSGEYKYTEDSRSEDPASQYGIHFYATVSPVNWLILTAESDITFIDSESTGESLMEASFFVLRKNDQTLSLPLQFRYFSGTKPVYEISAGIRYAL